MYCLLCMNRRIIESKFWKWRRISHGVTVVIYLKSYMYYLLLVFYIFFLLIVLTSLNCMFLGCTVIIIVIMLIANALKLLWPFLISNRFWNTLHVLASSCNILKFYSRLGDRSKFSLPAGLEPLSNKLRYLHCSAYPLKFLPSALSPEKLVEPCMPNSRVQRLWDVV